MSGWTKGEIIGVVGVAVALLGVGASIVVPELRSAAGLTPERQYDSNNTIEPSTIDSKEAVGTKRSESMASSIPRIQTITASSIRSQMGKITYDPQHLIDGLRRTAWVEGVPGPGYGESVTLHLTNESLVSRLWIDNGYIKSTKAFSTNNRVASLLVEHAGGSQRFGLSDTPHRQVLTLREPVRSSWVKLTIEAVYFAPDSIDTAISEIGVE